MIFEKLGYTSKKQLCKVLLKSIIRTGIAVTAGFLLAAYISGSYQLSTAVSIIYILLFIFIVGLDVSFGAPEKSFLVNGICTITNKEEDCDEKCKNCMKT